MRIMVRWDRRRRRPLEWNATRPTTYEMKNRKTEQCETTRKITKTLVCKLDFGIPELGNIIENTQPSSFLRRRKRT